uniref:Putative plant transposon protein domain-containing protein n=1 Tax=Solanum tuberosum TaxID=4113 RepID=M1DRI0_SOLTU
MPSQNESILHHPKAVLVGTIIDRENIKVWTIIVEEKVMRDQYEQTSLPFHVLIKKICQDARVLYKGNNDMQIIPASSTTFEGLRMIVHEMMRLVEVATTKHYAYSASRYHSVSLENLTARLDSQEKEKGSSRALGSMKGEHATKPATVGQLQSTNILMLWGEFPIPYAPPFMPPLMLRKNPHSSVKHELVVIVDDVVVDAERPDDDLVDETDEEELKSEEDQNGTTETLTDLQETDEMIA